MCICVCIYIYIHTIIYTCIQSSLSLCFQKCPEPIIDQQDFDIAQLVDVHPINCTIYHQSIPDVMYPISTINLPARCPAKRDVLHISLQNVLVKSHTESCSLAQLLFFLSHPYLDTAQTSQE